MAKTALITGASSGIGRCLAQIHARKGGDLVLVARSGDKLGALKEELEAKHKVTAHVLVEDLADAGAPQRIFDATEKAGLGIDYLINNAGFGGQGLFHERAWTDDRSMIEVNVIALTALTRLYLPVMVARGSGRVLNVSSTAGEMPGPLQAVYFATKAFVTSLSNALWEEVRGTGVTVTALLPGATESGFAETSGMENSPLFQGAVPPMGVAQAGYRAMMRGKLNVIAGVPFARRIVYAMAPLLPKKMLLKQVRKVQETG